MSEVETESPWFWVQRDRGCWEIACRAYGYEEEHWMYAGERDDYVNEPPLVVGANIPFPQG